MKVFISWSGDMSHGVAKALRDWLPSVLQAVEPYVSSEDIDKGARWSTDISKELEDSSFGIICVTPENLQAPWVNFEAGALSKSLDKSRVAPFLFGVERTAVQGPLLQFQSTLVERDDVKKLLTSVNGACDGSGLEKDRLDEVFEVWWPRLEEKLNAIDSTPAATNNRAPERGTKDLLQEVLELARGQQALLSNPERLFPPAYLDFALRDGGRRQDLPPRDHPVIRDLELSWRRVRQAMSVEGTVSDDLEDAVKDLRRPVEFLVGRSTYPRRRESPVSEPESED
jgi:hypothetical protein